MTKPLRVLILEDQLADAELVTCEFRKSGIPLVAKGTTDYLLKQRLPRLGPAARYTSKQKC